MASDITNKATPVPRLPDPSPSRRGRWVGFGYRVLLAALLTVRYESFELYRPDGTLLGWRKHTIWFVWEGPHADRHGRPEGHIGVHRYALLGLYQYSYVGQRARFPG